MSVTRTAAVSAALLLTLSAAVTAFQPAGGQPPTGPGGGQPPRGPGGPGGPGGGPGREGGPGGGRQQSVEGAMKQMNGALRRLKEQVGDAAKRDENLKIINDMQRGCVGAKGLPVPADVLGPKNPAGVLAPNDDAAKKTEGYHRDLIAAMRLMLDIETDLLDNKSDAAKAKLDALMKLRDEAHTRLGVKD